jgi:hypothetical protein
VAKFDFLLHRSRGSGKWALARGGCRIDLADVDLGVDLGLEVALVGGEAQVTIDNRTMSWRRSGIVTDEGRGQGWGRHVGLGVVHVGGGPWVTLDESVVVDGRHRPSIGRGWGRGSERHVGKKKPLTRVIFFLEWHVSWQERKRLEQLFVVEETENSISESRR